MESKLFKGQEIHIPDTPNFIRIGERGFNVNLIPIANFTEDEILAIGKAWTENLLKKQRKGIIK